MVLEVKIDHLRAEKMKVKHQSVFFGTPCMNKHTIDIHCIIYLPNGKTNLNTSESS